MSGVSIKTDDGLFGKIGTVRSTFLGIEDHGIFGFNITFDLSDSGTQGTGVLALSNSTKGTPAAGLFLRAICEVLGDDWEKANGKVVLCLYESDSYNSFIKGIQTVDGSKRVMWSDFYDD